MRILVIADRGLGVSIQQLLPEHDVVVDTDSTDGVAQVLSAELARPFDAVICDYRMTGMDGLAVYTALQTHREPPMFIVMADVDDLVVVAPIGEGILAKPFHAYELPLLLRRLTASRSHATTIRLGPMPAPHT